MKALKLILTTLLFLASFAAEAQNVVIYKDGNIVREYTAEQVDSVVYVPAKEVKYYYYVGTERPTAENLATIGTEVNGVNWTSDQPFAYTNQYRAEFYILVPKEKGKPILKNPSTDRTLGLDIYSEKDDVELEPIIKDGTEYTIWCPGIVAANTFIIYFQ